MYVWLIKRGQLIVLKYGGTNRIISTERQCKPIRQEACHIVFPIINEKMTFRIQTIKHFLPRTFRWKRELEKGINATKTDAENKESEEDTCFIMETRE